MKNIFKTTPLYIHLLFLSVFGSSLVMLICIYRVELLLKDVTEVFELFVLICLGVILLLYIGCIYFFNKQSKVYKSELFQTIQQNNVEYYIPTNEKQSLYMNMEIQELYNEMAQAFLEMMNDEQYRLDTAISYVHDMKLPLTTLSLILDKIEPAIDFNDYLSAQTSIQRLNKYIKEQLYLSQLTDLTNNLYYEKVDINQLWSEVIQELQAPIMVKMLKINKIGKPSIVRTDRRMLHFIFMQLLQNAIQYTDRGTITIEVEAYKCTIRDTGVGIPDFELPLIFKRGYTGKVYRQKKQTGMGLYLTERLASVLEITIDVDSEDGIGTAFSLQFEK